MLRSCLVLFGIVVATHDCVSFSCERSEPQINKASLTTIPDINLKTDADVDSENFTLLYQLKSCYKCSPLKLFKIPMKENCTTQIDSRFIVTLQINARNSSDNNESVIWTKEVSLTEHGEYHIHIVRDSEREVILFNFVPDYVNNAVNLPIYIAIAIFAVVAILFSFFGYLYRTDYLNGLKASVRKVINPTGHVTEVGDEEERTGLLSNESNGSVTTSRVQQKKRLRSLDTFRGFSLTVMIFANYGGGAYWFFDHSAWNGLTIADLVFPWFVWIMGTSISLALQSQVSRGVSKFSLVIKIWKRAIILFAIGIAMNTAGGVDLTELRIPGVLQRLSVSYLVVALLHLTTLQPSMDHEERWWTNIRDIVPYWFEWLVMAVFIIVHLTLTFLLPVEGCPTGYLGPGGLHELGKYINCTGGAAGYIDRKIFGVNHIYQYPTCKEIYHTVIPHEPEGTLGTLTSVFMCFLGLQAGKILTYRNGKGVCIRWIAWFIVTGLIAGILCKFSQNDGWIPVNKNLWSVSFVLALSSMAFLLLTVLYIVIDVLQFWNGAPFIYPGMNSILIYICHAVFGSYFPVSWVVPSTHAALLAIHLSGVSFWVIVSYIFHCKKIYFAI